MNRLRLISIALIVLVLATLACKGGDTTTPPPPPTSPPTVIVLTNTPRPQPTSAPTSEPLSEGASLEITNHSGVDIWYVQISPVKSDQWGDDWLGDAIIYDGETYVITDIPEGKYDVRALDENENQVEVWWEVDFAGEMTWTITGETADLGSLEVFNESDEDIGYLYISSVESSTWGDDWLGDSIIAVGESYIVEGIPDDTYDIKATTLEDELIEVLYNVPLSGANTWTVVGKTPLPSNAVLRFDEPFDDNRNNWGVAIEGEDVFYKPPEDGEYCILIKRDNFTAWEWYEPFRTDEFVAEVACTVSGADDASCGLGFGPDGDNIYWYEISPTSQTFGLFVLENDEWQDMLVEWDTSRNINPNGQNYMSLERVNGVVSMYVNGVLIAQVEDDRFPEGRVGIGGSTYDEGNATICLDNLRVWRLE